MDLYELAGALITISALIGYVNIKTLRLPTTIAVMAGALLLSLLLIACRYNGYDEVERVVESAMNQLDFRNFLLNGILNLLLFAGAININWSTLGEAKYEVGLLSFGSTVASTLLVAIAMRGLSSCLGVELPWLYAFFFGAVISPTDPIAVLAIFKELGAPKLLDTTVSGESLFNDGVAIVIFTTLFQLAFGHDPVTALNVGQLFFKLAVGGMLFGVVLGIVGYKMIASIDDPKVEILLTLTIATGGYYLAMALGVSGPLAMVTSGICIGNQGRHLAMSQKTTELLDSFWEMVDEILNAVLFFLIGAEILLLPNVTHGVILGLIMIPIILLVRAVTVWVPLKLLGTYRAYPKYFTRIVIWGGLRGGLAVALALSLPESPYRNIILVATYVKVVFSILIQGMTVKPLVKKINALP